MAPNNKAPKKKSAKLPSRKTAGHESNHDVTSYVTQSAKGSAQRVTEGLGRNPQVS